MCRVRLQTALGDSGGGHGKAGIKGQAREGARLHQTIIEPKEKVQG